MRLEINFPKRVNGTIPRAPFLQQIKLPDTSFKKPQTGQSLLHINKIFLCLLTLKLSKKTPYNWLARASGNKLSSSPYPRTRTHTFPLRLCQFTSPNSIRLLHYHNNSKNALRMRIAQFTAPSEPHSLTVQMRH